MFEKLMDAGNGYFTIRGYRFYSEKRDQKEAIGRYGYFISAKIGRYLGRISNYNYEGKDVGQIFIELKAIVSSIAGFTANIRDDADYEAIYEVVTDLANAELDKNLQTASTIVHAFLAGATAGYYAQDGIISWFNLVHGGRVARMQETKARKRLAALQQKRSVWERHYANEKSADAADVHTASELGISKRTVQRMRRQWKSQEGTVRLPIKAPNS